MMRSRLWLNLGLLALVGALSAIVILEPGKTPPPEPEPLTRLKPEAVTRVHLQRRDDDDIVLEKRHGRWWLKQPWPLPANDFRVQSLLRLLEAKSQSRHDLAGLDLAKFGLDQPRATVTFNGELRIDFGGTEPLSHRRYVRLGEALHTIFDTFYYQAAATPESFVDHALLPPGSQLRKLVLPDLVLEKKDGRWQRTPAHPELSADASIELVDAWRTTRALDVRPQTKLPETKEAGRIEVWLEGREQPLRFTLLVTDDDAFLWRDDLKLAWQIMKESVDKLLKLPAPETAEDGNATEKPSAETTHP